MQKSEWWKDFFSGLALDMWRLAVTPEQTKSEADFIQQRLLLAPPASVLDVPCGSGRLIIEMASRGFTMSGTDISSDFLHEARSSASAAGLAVSLDERDMRELPPEKKFDGAFCFGNSFGYLDDEGNAAFLRAVRGVLRPGGRFLLDAASVAENVIPLIRPHTEMEFGGIRFIEDNRYDHELGRLDTEYTFVRGDVTEKKFGSHRIYSYREIRTLLEEAGFVDIRSYGSMAGEPFALGAQGLYFDAKRGD